MTLAAIIDTLEARVAARELLDLRETADLARALRDVVDDGVRADELLDGLAAEFLAPLAAPRHQRARAAGARAAAGGGYDLMETGTPESCVPSVAMMTRQEREALAKLIRQRERLAKTGAAERSAVLLADFEQQADRMYAYDEDDVWRQAVLAAKEEVAKASVQISKRCSELGIPQPFAPTLSVVWHQQRASVGVERARCDRWQNAASNRSRPRHERRSSARQWRRRKRC